MISEIQTPEVVALLNQFQIPRHPRAPIRAGFQNSKTIPIRPRRIRWKPWFIPEPMTTTTTAGWFENLPNRQREVLHKCWESRTRQLSWAMIRAALASPANTAIIPRKTFWNWGRKARMNFTRNCQRKLGWRIQTGVLTEMLAQRVRSLTWNMGELMDGDLAPATRFPEDDLTPANREACLMNFLSEEAVRVANPDQRLASGGNEK